MNIYLASSWRNELQAEVLAALRLDGHTVYDFKNPTPGNTGFAWKEIGGPHTGKCSACGEEDPSNWPGWCPKGTGRQGPTDGRDRPMAHEAHQWQGQWSAAYFATEVLDHPIAAQAFGFDMEALEACSACVLLEPCGRSAHLELGYAVGQGKLTVVYIPELPSPPASPRSSFEPELMLRMCDYVETTLDSVRRALTNDRPTPRWQRDVAQYDADADRQAQNGAVGAAWHESLPDAVIAKDTYAAVDERVGPCRPYLHRMCRGCGHCWRHRRCTCVLEKP